MMNSIKKILAENNIVLSPATVLQSLRESRLWSQEYTAQISGVHIYDLIGYENGKLIPKEDRIKLADVFRTVPETFEQKE